MKSTTLLAPAALAALIAVTGCGGSASAPGASAPNGVVPLTRSVANDGASHAAAQETVIYNFAGLPDCSSPNSSLVSDGNGNFWGVGSSGGNYGLGCVFELSSNGHGGYSEKVLYSFAGGVDGESPNSIYRDGSGNIWGYGGSSNAAPAGTLWKLTPNGNSWSFAVAYAFTGGSNASSPAGSIVITSSGVVYGASLGGGTHGDGTVFQLTPGQSGYTETDIHDFAGSSADGSYPQGGVSMTPSGEIVGTTVFGGPHNGGVVFALVPSGQTFAYSIPYFFNKRGTDTDLYNPESAPISDANGNLYGTASQVFGGIYKLAPGNGGAYTYKILIKFKKAKKYGEQPDGAPIMDASGNFFGTTVGGGASSKGAVFKVAPNGTTYAETLLHSFGGSDGNRPDIFGLYEDANGVFYGMTQTGGSNNYGAIYSITQ